MRPMKFWETMSAFRGDEKALREIFENERWWTPYFQMYSNFNALLEKQRRDVLDILLPIELTREIAARYNKEIFHFYPEKLLLRCAGVNDPPDKDCIEMTALEVHDRFGGSFIEEVFEYGSAHIPSDL
jgi:hypothetical protein